MSDIVERLRRSVTKGFEPTDEDAIEAANEIEKLRELCEAYKGQVAAGAVEIERAKR